MEASSIKEFILYQDHHLVVAIKPTGMPVQEDKTGDSSLLKLLEHYCKQKLHLCNRIDRPVAGLVILSKQASFSKSLQEQMDKKSFVKKYLALVPKSDLPKHGSLNHQLEKQKNKAVVSEGGKNVELSYRCLVEMENYDVWELTTNTGMFHQIRAQLGDKGVPLRGDVKYGARRSNKDRSIGLLAYYLSFYHPTKQQQMEFTCPFPKNDIWPSVDAALKKEE